MALMDLCKGLCDDVNINMGTGFEPYARQSSTSNNRLGNDMPCNETSQILIVKSYIIIVH